MAQFTPPHPIWLGLKSTITIFSNLKIIANMIDNRYQWHEMFSALQKIFRRTASKINRKKPGDINHVLSLRLRFIYF